SFLLLHFCQCYVFAATLLLFTNHSHPATSTICYRFGATFLRFPSPARAKHFVVNAPSFCFPPVSCGPVVLWSLHRQISTVIYTYLQLSTPEPRSGLRPPPVRSPGPVGLSS